MGGPSRIEALRSTTRYLRKNRHWCMKTCFLHQVPASDSVATYFGRTLRGSLRLFNKFAPKGNQDMALQELETANHPASLMDYPEVDFLHEIGSRMAECDSLHEVLAQVVEFATAVVKCDSCFVYVLEKDELGLRASKNAHPEAVDRLKLKLGQGITGWVAEHRQPVSVPSNAAQDPRFQRFSELPEDSFQAFLSVPVLSRQVVVGVINVHHRRPHVHDYSA